MLSCCCARPPGAVMIAPPTALRHALGSLAQSEAIAKAARVRWGERRRERNGDGQEQERVGGKPQEARGAQKAWGEGCPNGRRTGRIRIPDGGIQGADRAAAGRRPPQEGRSTSADKAKAAPGEMKGAASEKTWDGSQEEEEALRTDPQTHPTHRPIPQLHLYRPIKQARSYAP